jgi:hypothetical protein
MAEAAVHEWMNNPNNPNNQKQIKFNTQTKKWEYTGLTRPSTISSAVEHYGGGRKSKRSSRKRSRRNSKKQKRVRHTRRKQTRRHRHSRRR